MLEGIKSIESKNYYFKSKTLGEIEIIFENGKFFNCIYHFSGNYSREQWRELAEIEAKITELESKIP